jgi:hypothetical protein
MCYTRPLPHVEPEDQQILIFTRREDTNTCTARNFVTKASSVSKSGSKSRQLLWRVEDVSALRLEVHGEGPIPLPAALVHAAGRLGEAAEYQYQTVAGAIGAPAAGNIQTDVWNGDADSPADFEIMAHCVSVR